MSEVTKTPAHFRLLTALKAIGPYLRECQSRENFYLFDCLSVCVNDKKSPEDREFWGWWMELELQDQQFAARYRIGRYDSSGDWQEERLPAKATAEVTRTQEDFHQKLVELLDSRFNLAVELHKESVEFV
ncbi:sigma factor-binding protein Crl [Vibrio sp.]|uniref:sigma factor-binding protein Crl n=1 Tax=Vibrio sp. TaxID=678 RepID=UPI003D0CF724